MADTKKPTTAEGIVGDNLNKLGSYKEAPGGGTPLDAGQKAPSKDWVKSHRVMQPRDENGQFTYNSVNKKPLKYGPSRGTTVPPFLRGIKITAALIKDATEIAYNGSIWKGKLSMLDSKEFWESFKEYDTSVEGGFKIFQQGGAMEKKRGARNKKEKAALAAGEKGIIGTRHEGKWIDANKFVDLANKYKKMIPTGYSIKKIVKKNPPISKTTASGSGFIPKNPPQPQKSTTTMSSTSPTSGGSSPAQFKLGNDVLTKEFSQEDFDLLKSNQEEFINKNKQQLQEIYTQVKKARDDAGLQGQYGITKEKILAALGSGKFKTPQSIIDRFKKIFDKKKGK